MSGVLDRTRDHAETYIREVADAVAATVREKVGVAVAAGRDPHSLGSPADIAAIVATRVHEQHPWDAQFGPFYDTAAVRQILGVSKQAVNERVRRRSMLAATTSDGRVVYPVFQFGDPGVRRDVSTVVSAFRDVDVDGWAIGAWFSTPAAALQRLTPVQWLLDGRGVQPVQELATETAARWSAP